MQAALAAWQEFRGAGSRRAFARSCSDFGCSIGIETSGSRQGVHGSRRLPHFTLEAPDHAVTTRSFAGACEPVPRLRTTRSGVSTNECEAILLFWAERDQLALIARCRTTTHARCSAAHQIRAAPEISGSTCFTRCLAQRALISPASQIGRHRAMSGLSTMTHVTTHATKSSLVPNLLSDEKVLLKNGGSMTCSFQCSKDATVSACGCRYANLVRDKSPIRSRRTARCRAMRICF